MNLKDIKFGKPQAFNVIIEIPKGSEIKYEYNADTDSFFADFTFTGGFHFPFNYGFLPQTLQGDGDPIDVMVITTNSLKQGVVVCKAVGIIELLDRGEQDNKILAVPITDTKYQDIKDFSEKELQEFRDFYAGLARQKQKIIEIKGFHGKDKALEEIQKSRIST